MTKVDTLLDFKAKNMKNNKSKRKQINILESSNLSISR